MVGVSHFLMITPKASFLGVVGFGRFVPDSGSGSVTILTAMVNLP